jgi:hypothetical protein
VPTHERVIHVFLAACFMVASVCTLKVAAPLSGGPETLLWIFDLPIIAMAGHGLSRAFSRAAEV